MLNKKLNKTIASKVLLLLALLKVVLVEDLVEADLLKDVVLKLLVLLKGMAKEAVVEAALLKDVVSKILVKDLLLQALKPALLSQAMRAKLKLIKVQADKVLLLKALLHQDLTSAKVSSSRSKL